MQFIFDLEVVSEGAETKSNAIKSSLVGALSGKKACVCSETCNAAKEMSDAAKQFLANNSGCVRYNEDDDFTSAGAIGKQIKDMLNPLPPRTRNRYALMFAKAIKFGCTIVIVEKAKSRFSVAKACEVLKIPYMSLTAFVLQNP